jgi:hypothetical protein
MTGKEPPGTRSLKKRVVLNTSISVASTAEKARKPIVRRERSLQVGDPCAAVSDTLNNFAAAGIAGLGGAGLQNEHISQARKVDLSASEVRPTDGDAGQTSFFLNMGNSWARTFNPVFGTALPLPVADAPVQSTLQQVEPAISHEAQNSIVSLQSDRHRQHVQNDLLTQSVGKSDEAELQIEVRLASSELISFEGTRSSTSKRGDDATPIYYLSDDQNVDDSKKVDEVRRDFDANRLTVLPWSGEEDRASGSQNHSRRRNLDVKHRTVLPWSEEDRTSEPQNEALLTTKPVLKINTNPMIAGSGSDDDTPEIAPAVDTKAVMAALESTLPQQVRDEDHLSPTHTIKSPKPKRVTPRKKKGKNNKKPTKPPSPLMEIKKDQAGRMKPVTAAKQKAVTGKESNDEKRRLERKVSLPKEIALSSDDPVSDLDQSIRHFPMKQIFAGGSVDVSGLGHSRDDVSASTNNEEEVDRYAPLISSGQKGVATAVGGIAQNRGPRALADSLSETERHGLGHRDWAEENVASRKELIVSTEGLVNGCLQSPLSQFLFNFPWSSEHLVEDAEERKQAIDPKEGYKIIVPEPHSPTRQSHQTLLGDDAIPTRFPDPPRRNHDFQSEEQDESVESQQAEDNLHVRKTIDPLGLEPAPSRDWKRRNGTDPPTSEKFIVYETGPLLNLGTETTTSKEDKSDSRGESTASDQVFPNENITGSFERENLATAKGSSKRQADTSLGAEQSARPILEPEEESEVDRYTSTDLVSPGSPAPVVPAFSNCDDIFTDDRRPLPALLSTIHEEDSQGIADTGTGSLGKQSEIACDDGRPSALNQTFVNRILQFGQDSLGLSPRSRKELNDRMQDLSPASKRVLEKSIKQAKVERSLSEVRKSSEFEIIDLTGVDEDDLFKKAEDDDDVWIFDLTKRSDDEDSFRDIDELLGFASARLGVSKRSQRRPRAWAPNPSLGTLNLKQDPEAVIIVQGETEGSHVVVKGNDTWISLEDAQKMKADSGLELSSASKDRYYISSSNMEDKSEVGGHDRYSVDGEVEEDRSGEDLPGEGNASRRHHCEPVSESNTTCIEKREDRATSNSDAVICGMEEYEILYPATPPGPSTASKQGAAVDVAAHRPLPNLTLGIETGRDSRLSDEYASRMSSLTRLSSKTVDPGPLAPKIGQGVSGKRVFNFVFTGDEDTQCLEEEEPVNGSGQTTMRGLKPEDMHFVRRVVKEPSNVLEKASLTRPDVALDNDTASPVGESSPKIQHKDENDRSFIQEYNQPVGESSPQIQPEDENDRRAFQQYRSPSSQPNEAYGAETPQNDDVSVMPDPEGSFELEANEGVEFLDFLCDGPLIVCGGGDKEASLKSTRRRHQHDHIQTLPKGTGTSTAHQREAEVCSPIASFEVDIPQADKKKQKRFFASYLKTKQAKIDPSESPKNQDEKSIEPEANLGHDEKLRQSSFVELAQQVEVVDKDQMSSDARMNASSFDQHESPLLKIQPSNAIKSAEENPQSDHDLLDAFFEGTESFMCPDAAESASDVLQERDQFGSIAVAGASKGRFNAPRPEEMIGDRSSAGPSACPSGVTEPVCNRRQGPSPEEYLAQKKPRPHPESIAFRRKENQEKQKKYVYRKGPAPEENSLADWLERNTVVVERGPVPEENRVVVCGVRVVKGIDVRRPTYSACQDIQEVEGKVVDASSDAPSRSATPCEDTTNFTGSSDTERSYEANVALGENEGIPASYVPTVSGVDLNTDSPSSSAVGNVPGIHVVPGVDEGLPGIHVVPGVDVGTNREAETAIVRAIDDLCFDISKAFSVGNDSHKIRQVVQGVPCDTRSEIQEVQEGEDVTHTKPSASDYIAWAAGKYDLSNRGLRATTPSNVSTYLPQSGAVTSGASNAKDIEVFESGSHGSQKDIDTATHWKSGEEAADGSRSDPNHETGTIDTMQPDTESTQAHSVRDESKSAKFSQVSPISIANAATCSSQSFRPNSVDEEERVSQAETKKAGNGRNARGVDPTEGPNHAAYDEVQDLQAELDRERSATEAKRTACSSDSDLELRLDEITGTVQLSPRTALRGIARDAGDSISCAEDSAIVASILQTARVIGWGLRNCNADSGTRTTNAEVTLPEILLGNDHVRENESSDSQDSKSHMGSTYSSRAKARSRADAIHEQAKDTLSQGKQGLSPRCAPLSPNSAPGKSSSMSIEKPLYRSPTQIKELEQRVKLPSVGDDTIGRPVPLEIDVRDVNNGEPMNDVDNAETRRIDSERDESPRLGSIESDDESGLLLALTRSEGEPPVTISSEGSSTATKESRKQKEEQLKVETIEQRLHATEGIPAAVVVKEGGGPRKEFTRSPKLQKVLERLRRRKRNGGSDQSVSSDNVDPVDVDELFSRYDDIVKHMVVFDNDRLQRAQGGQLSLLGDLSVEGNKSQTKEPTTVTNSRKETRGEIRQSDVIDVTDVHSTPFKLKRRATSQLRFRETIKVKQRAASQPKSRDFSSLQVSSSFGSEASTPSQKARDLRKQLDLALKTSAAIRTTQERLGAELSNFKLKFQKQRESLSPARSRGSPRSVPLISPKTKSDSESHRDIQHPAFPSPTVTEQTIVSGETPQVKEGSILPDVPAEVHRPMMAMTGNVVTTSSPFSKETRLTTASPTFEQAVNVFDKIVSGQRLKAVTARSYHDENPDESRQPESPASSRPLGATATSSPTSTRQSSDRSPATTEYESSVSQAYNDTSRNRLQLAHVTQKKKASSPASISDASPFSSSTRRSVSEMSPIYYTIKDPKSAKNKSNPSPNFDKLATLMDADQSSDEELLSSSGEVSHDSKEGYNGMSIYSPHDDYYDDSFSDDDAVKMKQLESIINGLRSAEERQQFHVATTTPKARASTSQGLAKTGKKSSSRKKK